LTKEDWQEMDEAFSSNADPLVGVDARASFDELFARLVNLAPQPFGLNSELSVAG